MASLEVYSAFETRCPECSWRAIDRQKYQSTRNGAAHAMYAHNHPADDGCGCPLVQAMNNPRPIIWIFDTWR